MTAKISEETNKLFTQWMLNNIETELETISSGWGNIIFFNREGTIKFKLSEYEYSKSRELFQDYLRAKKSGFSSRYVSRKFMKFVRFVNKKLQERCIKSTGKNMIRIRHDYL